ncbi:MAG TPA: hypothetical protein VM308_07615 [Sphingomicrobium sp.]|nr:hypothetical protein [Sphingomicrobium sp.]
MTDRGFWVAGSGLCGNVRRLMYQSLIWAFVLGDDPGRLGAAVDTKDLQRLADALIDRMRRNVELARDFLRGQMLVDEQKAVELARTEPRHSLRHKVCRAVRCSLLWRLGHVLRILQDHTHSAQHCGAPEQRVWVSFKLSVPAAPDFPQI